MDPRLGYILDLNIDVILTSYSIIMSLFHFHLDLMLYVDEKIYVKIQDLVTNLTFDIHVHNIDICYFLKVNVLIIKRYLS